MSPLYVHPLYQRTALAIAVAAPLMLMAARPAEAADATDCQSIGRSTLDARLAAKADEGVRPFVLFVQRTRTIYQLDVNEAVKRVARHRATVASCTVASNPAS